MTHGMDVGTRGTGLCSAETDTHLTLSHTTLSKVYTKWCEKQKTQTEQQISGIGWEMAQLL